jgi:hypothetical protein
VRFIVAVALTGCLGHEHLVRHNAPGDVDLTTPLPHENGDPKRFELPKEPGTTLAIAYLGAYLLGGHGRVSGTHGSWEYGNELRLERYSSDTEHATITDDAWAVTVGLGVAQWGGGRNTDTPAGAYLEANRRWVPDGFPLDVGLGPAYESGHIGGQLSLRIPLLMLRSRYVQDNGFEVMVGFELPIWAFTAGWSH